MKLNVLPLALVVVTLSTHCASRDGFIDSATNDCASGSGVEIRAGFDPSAAPHADRMGGGSLIFLVEVANLTDDEITVASIRIDPLPTNNDDAYRLDHASRRVDRAIAEGAASTFDIPMTGGMPTPSGLQRPRNAGRVIAADVAVTVALTNGETHRCRFRVPVPA